MRAAQGRGLHSDTLSVPVCCPHLFLCCPGLLWQGSEGCEPEGVASSPAAQREELAGLKAAGGGGPAGELASRRAQQSRTPGCLSRVTRL